MELNIQPFEAFTVVGIMKRVTPGDPEIPKIWDAFVPRMNEIQHRAEQHLCFGVMDNFNHDKYDFDYIASASVTNADNLPEGMSSMTVPKQEYAVFDTTLQTIGETFHNIYQTWLPASDYVRAEGAEFELYDESFNPEEGKFHISVWIPVKAK